MSWRDYQENTRTFRVKRTYTPVVGIILALGIGLFLFFSFSKRSIGDEKPRARVEESDNGTVTLRSKKFGFHGYIPVSDLDDGPQEVTYHKGDENFTAHLSLDSDLQKFITKQLIKNKVDWAGVSVVDPTTGRVLALAHHSEREPGKENLALTATFPAASVFKIVTAAAGLEEGLYNRKSEVRYQGDLYGIARRQVLGDSGYNRMKLDTAFAKSANIIFGRMGAHQIGAERLREFADRFAFNEEMPFAVPVQMSTATISGNDKMDAAKAAAGFGDITLSPLHGALIAGAILNEGIMMEPYLVERVVNDQGETVYEVEPKIWRKPIGAVTARDMRSMMVKTLTEGTSRKFFRGVKRDKVLGKLMMGGKTGSLVGTNPPGRNEWLVAYARSRYRQVAVSVVITSHKYWRIKPSDLTRKIFDYYFSPKPVLEANASRHLRKSLP